MIVINDLIWILIESNDNYIVNLGLFTSFEKAVGEGFRIASDMGNDIDGEVTMTQLYKLEADSGWGFDVIRNEEVINHFYILEVCNEGDIISDQL